MVQLISLPFSLSIHLIQTPVPDSLGEVLGQDIVATAQVTYSTSHLEDLVMRAGGKAQRLNGGIEEFPGPLVEPGVFPELFRGHPGIDDRRGPRKTLFLDAPGAGRPDADAFGAFSFGGDIKFPGGQVAAGTGVHFLIQTIFPQI